MVRSFEAQRAVRADGVQRLVKSVRAAKEQFELREFTSQGRRTVQVVLVVCDEGQASDPALVIAADRLAAGPGRTVIALDATGGLQWTR